MGKIVLPAGPTKRIRVDRDAIARNREDGGRRPQWVTSVIQTDGNVTVHKSHWLAGTDMVGSSPDDPGVFLITVAELTLFIEDDADERG